MLFTLASFKINIQLVNATKIMGMVSFNFVNLEIGNEFPKEII
jgi:hypothetical protein